MLELIRDLGHNKDVSLILSSHLLPDVEYTCDHVVVMDKGQVAAQGPIDELKGPAGRVFELRVKVAAGTCRASSTSCRRPGWSATRPTKTSCACSCPRRRRRRSARDQQIIFALAAKEGVQVRHLRPSVPTLEDVFAKAVGEE